VCAGLWRKDGSPVKSSQVWSYFPSGYCDYWSTSELICIRLCSWHYPLWRPSVSQVRVGWHLVRSLHVVDPSSGQVVVAQRPGCIAAATGIIQRTEGSAFVEMLSICWPFRSRIFCGCWPLHLRPCARPFYDSCAKTDRRAATSQLSSLEKIWERCVCTWPGCFTAVLRRWAAQRQVGKRPCFFLSTLEIILSMRYINVHFTYLLTSGPVML